MGWLAGACGTVSNGGRTITNNNCNTWDTYIADLSKTSGKIYFEMVLTFSFNRCVVGVALDDTVTQDNYLGIDSKGWSYYVDGAASYVIHAGSTSGYGTSYLTGETIGIAVDMSTNKIWFARNNTWIGDPIAGTGEAFSNLGASIIPGVSFRYDGNNAVAAWLGSDQTYSPPTGFSPIEQPTVSTSVDSVLDVLDTDVDTILQKSLSKTLSADGILDALDTEVGVLLQKSIQKSSDIDSALKYGHVNPLDSVLKYGHTRPTDVILQKSVLKTSDLDTKLFKTEYYTSSVDVILYGTNTKNTSIDGILQGSESLTITTVATLIEETARWSMLDIILKATVTKADAKLQKSIDTSISCDAWLAKEQDQTASVDSVLSTLIFKDIDVSSVLKKTDSKEISVAPVLSKEESLNISLDMYLLKSVLLEPLVDATLFKSGLSIFTKIGSLLKVNGPLARTDVILVDRPYSWVDSLLKVNGPVTSLDAILSRELIGELLRVEANQYITQLIAEDQSIIQLVSEDQHVMQRIEVTQYIKQKESTGVII